jgi:hypothetical protein
VDGPVAARLRRRVAASVRLSPHRRSVIAAALLALLLVDPGDRAAAAEPPNDPRYADQWALPDADVASAWDRGVGAGVSVAVVSTGISETGTGAPQHPDLQSVDLTVSYPKGSTADESGIGTHLAGVVAAAMGNGIGIVGVAPGATIVPVKAYTSGSVDVEAFLLALRSIDPVPPVVLVDVPSQMPTTGPKADELRSELAALAAKGATVAVGALPDNVLAGLPVLSVASVIRPTDAAAPTAGRTLTPNTSPAPEGLSAPGGAGASANAAILSTDIPPFAGGADAYQARAGVAPAAAHVAGAAALLRGLGATDAVTRELILSTARDLGDRAMFGRGLLDVGAAVASYHAPDATTSTTATKKRATTTSKKAPVTTPTTRPGPLPRDGRGGPIAPPDPLDPAASNTGTPAPAALPVSPDAAHAVVPAGDADGSPPWAVLASAAGALCLAGSGLSLALRRLAAAAQPPS